MSTLHHILIFVDLYQRNQIEVEEQACVSVCVNLLEAVLLEESHGVAVETLAGEVDLQRVKQELSQNLVERVIQEVVDSETQLIIRDTYRYHTICVLCIKCQ